MHFSADVVTISDGIYDAMIDQMLASGAPIEVPFKNYFSFQQLNQSMNQTTAFRCPLKRPVTVRLEVVQKLYFPTTN